MPGITQCVRIFLIGGSWRCSTESGAAEPDPFLTWSQDKPEF